MSTVFGESIDERREYLIKCIAEDLRHKEIGVLEGIARQHHLGSRMPPEYSRVLIEGIEAATRQAGANLGRLTGLLHIIKRCGEFKDYYIVIRRMIAMSDKDLTEIRIDSD